MLPQVPEFRIAAAVDLKPLLKTLQMREDVMKLQVRVGVSLVAVWSHSGFLAVFERETLRLRCFSSAGIMLRQLGGKTKNTGLNFVSLVGGEGNEMVAFTCRPHTSQNARVGCNQFVCR